MSDERAEHSSSRIDALARTSGTSETGPGLLVTCTQAGDGVRIAARGEIDCASAPSFLTELQTVVADTGGSILIDLGDVTFIDSSGVKALATVRASADGRLKLGRLHPAVRRVLEMTALLDVFELDGDGPSRRPADRG